MGILHEIWVTGCDNLYELGVGLWMIGQFLGILLGVAAIYFVFLGWPVVFAIQDKWIERRRREKGY